MYKVDKTLGSSIEDISAPKVVQVRKRKHKTISTANAIKVLEDNKKARLNRRMFKSIQGMQRMTSGDPKQNFFLAGM
jgi:hypothetical protein